MQEIKNWILEISVSNFNDKISFKNTYFERKYYDIMICYMEDVINDDDMICYKS